MLLRILLAVAQRKRRGAEAECTIGRPPMTPAAGAVPGRLDESGGRLPAPLLPAARIPDGTEDDGRIAARTWLVERAFCDSVCWMGAPRERTCDSSS